MNELGLLLLDRNGCFLPWPCVWRLRESSDSYQGDAVTER